MSMTLDPRDDRNILGSVVAWIMRTGSLVAILALAYMLYATFWPEALSGFGSLPVNDRARIVNNLSLARSIFLVSLTLALVAACARFWDEKDYGYIFGVIGLGLFLGLPFMVGQQAQSFSIGPRSPAATVTALLVDGYRWGGIISLALAVLMVIGDMVDRLQGKRVARARQALKYTELSVKADDKRKVRDKLLGKCWELPYCRPVIRDHCPVYLKRTQACWKNGIGCMCDDRITTYALRLKSATEGASDETPSHVQASFNLDAAQRAMNAKLHRGRCHACAIYQHHQEHKYRVLAPVAITLVIVGMGAALPQLLAILTYLGGLADRATQVLSFGVGRSGEFRSALQYSVAESRFIQSVVLLAVALILLSYLLRSIEWVVFKAKW
jgi:hypothetical protein